MLQYLISGNSASEIVSITNQALDKGCRWIRVDLSEVPKNDIEPLVKALQEKCSDCEAFLSVENDVDMVIRLKLAGIHLTASYLPTLIETRKALGEEPIMGVTIEDSAQVPFLPRTAIDYIAVKGSDLDNCQRIVQQMRDSNLDEPVVATFAPDMSLEKLMSTGIDGIAVYHSTTLPSDLPQLLAALTTFLERRLTDN